jgi:hypothetical protein
MLVIEILPSGVKSIHATGRDGLEQDLTLLVWPMVRRHVEKMDRQLRKEWPALRWKITPEGAAGDGV